MPRDGTKSGFDLALTRAVADAVTVPVIASGGVGGLDDLADGVTLGLPGVLLALPGVVVLQVIAQKVLVEEIMDNW